MKRCAYKLLGLPLPIILLSAACLPVSSEHRHTVGYSQPVVSSMTGMPSISGAFPNRLHKGNDGTAYEPCFGPSDEQLRKLGLDPATRRDTAIIEGEKARGCKWRGSNSIGTQYVANESLGNLAEYKRNYSSAHWGFDMLLRGRQVMVKHDGRLGCTTIVASGKSIVFTSALWVMTGPEFDVCRRAIDFLAATLPKIPE